MTGIAHRDFYHHHRGIILNVVSVGIFLLLDRALQGDLDMGLRASPPLAWLFLLVMLAEPWATYYNMGAFNARRVEAGYKPILLQRLMRQSLFLVCLFWGGRLALFGALLLSSFDMGPFMAEHSWMGMIVMLFIAVREGFNVYYWGSETPISYNPVTELLADISLVILLAFGELFAAELFNEFSFGRVKDWGDVVPLLFFIPLLSLMFYIPIRFVYTLEDATFARTAKERLEFVASFLIVFLAMIMR